MRQFTPTVARPYWSQSYRVYFNGDVLDPRQGPLLSLDEVDLLPKEVDDTLGALRGSPLAPPPSARRGPEPYGLRTIKVGNVRFFERYLGDRGSRRPCRVLFRVNHQTGEMEILHCVPEHFVSDEVREQLVFCIAALRCHLSTATLAPGADDAALDYLERAKGLMDPELSADAALSMQNGVIFLIQGLLSG